MSRRVSVWGLAVIAGVLGAGLAAAQEDAPELGWWDSAEISFVFTEGNSDTETIGISNTLGKRWETSRFQVKLDAIRSDTADDRVLIVDPGITWLPGETPNVTANTIETPPVEPDVEKYFVRGFYESDYGPRRSWRVGASWDRNEDAGILNRYVVDGGLGTRWRDTKDLRLYTGYALSLTDREEETPDPEKEDRFAGTKLTFEYMDKWGQVTTFNTDLVGNLNLEDTKDYSLDMTNSISVSMSSRLSLRVSLEWIYASEPALEEVDILGRFVVRDPDGIPGSGDEFFETVLTGGAEVELGEGDIRKDQLDTIFRASLVFDF